MKPQIRYKSVVITSEPSCAFVSIVGPMSFVSTSTSNKYCDAAVSGAERAGNAGNDKIETAVFCVQSWLDQPTVWREISWHCN
eukprot:COSAG01_NODE_8887_length_2626_cov_2.205382_1_plen_83_part_00